MIQRLNFAEPFFRAEYVEAEPSYPVSEPCLILNLAGRSEPAVRIGDFLLESFDSAVIGSGSLAIPGQALVIRGFNPSLAEDDRTAEQMKKNWKSLWEYSHLERNRDIPYYKSPRSTVGRGIGMNFCLAEADAPSAIHREHGEDFDEIHLQVCGTGRVQIFLDEDPGTLCAELPLCPGTANRRIWDEQGNYPWHRYHSSSRSVFVVIEKNRGGKA